MAYLGSHIFIISKIQARIGATSECAATSSVLGQLVTYGGARKGMPLPAFLAGNSQGPQIPEPGTLRL